MHSRCSTPPSSARHWLYYDLIEAANFGRIHEYITWGRWAMMPLSLGCCALIFTWARRLYGDGGGLLAAALWAIDPTVLAQGSMLSTDIGLTLSVVAAAMAWDAFLRRPTTTAAIAAVVLIAIAQITKYTAMLLWPAMIAVALLHGGARRNKRREVVIALLIGGILTWVVLNACYGFRHVGDRLDSFFLQSQFGATIKSVLPAGTPVPLARHLFEGFDAQKFDAEGYFAHTLLGEGYFGTDWRFYPLAVLFKSPLGELAMLGMLVISLILKRPSRAEWALVIFALTFYLGLNFVVDLTSGLRYLLVLYPFVMILAGRVMTIPRLSVAAVAAVTLAALEIGAIAPRFHAFFNVIARQDRMAVPDLGWGQSLLDLRDWMRENGETSVAVFNPARTSPAVYGLQPGDATAAVTTRYVALPPVFLGGIPVKYRTEFVLLRPWRRLLQTKPAADFGGILLYRTEDVPGAADGTMFAIVQSWTDALTVPEIAPIRGLEKRLRKQR